ncbi:hypothetical protein [Wenxinia saemankumensis]|uniref:DUF2157 domain-containing protein n=1 Tax=Wenxinia saemankumensis TaxID=1447782 RepID=A0A1M6G321_9RHOB|nr:hypothetical protein [Wenxinia saemankumensis]SHJ04272.1 hypothetical protein SAMN05444417_2648 [Wenxinia saemankumensis]
MIEADDLKAAVAAGTITERQAAQLSALAHARSGARTGLRPGDEPFELFRGFNEIFIVVGLVILAFGWSSVAGIAVAAGGGGNFFTGGLIASGITAAVIWALAEYFTRRRRMVAPSIALALFWAGNAVAFFSLAFSQPFMVAQADYSSLPIPMALATLALLGYWARFRVPFAMALIAVGAFATAMVAAAARAGTPETLDEVFLLSSGGPFAWITLLLGIVVFAVAMVFDMSDPHRVTRRSAQGFWLHVVAAPALVNTVALTLLSRETPAANMMLFAVLVVFALVAVVIDRRSFLIAAVGYSVTLGFAVFGTDGAAWSVLGLGIVLLLLGAFWERIRAGLLRLLGPVLPLNRLPPSSGVSE